MMILSFSKRVYRSHTQSGPVKMNPSSTNAESSHIQRASARHRRRETRKKIVRFLWQGVVYLAAAAVPLLVLKACEK